MRRADCSDDESAELSGAALTIGLGMLATSRSGPIGKLREVIVLTRCLSLDTLPVQFQRNSLVLAALKSPVEQNPWLGMYIDPSSESLATLLAAIMIARLRLVRCCEHVAALLATKATPAEALGMKRWLWWIARQVAEASGDGFLGLGRKLSDEEARALTQIAVALQLPSDELYLNLVLTNYIPFDTYSNSPPRISQN